MIAMMIRKIMNEKERMVASHSQELGPRIGEMGWSDTYGLKFRVLMIFILQFDFFSRVTKALIWISTKEGISMDIGKIRLSIERSEEVLNVHIKVIFGILQVFIELM